MKKKKETISIHEYVLIDMCIQKLGSIQPEEEKRED